MEVKHHTLIKHKILEQFIKPCNIALRKGDGSKGKFGDLTYVETHAGDGDAFIRELGKTFDGSATIVAKMQPSIKCIFIENDAESAVKLHKKIDALGNSQIIVGDCNKKLKPVLDDLPKDSIAIVFVDPFKYKDLKWDTVMTIKNRPRTDMILNFPIGIVNREVVNPVNWKGLHVFFGTEDWVKHKDSSVELVKFYLQRLNYKYYSVHLVRSVERNAPLYLIILGTDSPLSHRIGSWVLYKTIEKWVKETFPRIVHNMRSLKEFT